MAAPAEKLVPVHDEPGAVQFKYNTSYVALGGGLALGGGGGGGANGAAAAEPLSVWEERPQAAEPAKLPPPLEDLDDFISLEEAAPAAQAADAEPAAAEAAAAAAAGAAGAAAAVGGGVGNLLDDYVSLGILEDPAAAASKKAAAAARSQRPELLQCVPWMAALKGIRSPLLRLHQEIVEFCRYLAPSPAEQAARQAAIDRIEDVVTSIWPKARVQVFGSFATGLYLPTSDVDAVIMGSGCADVPQGLKALANALARRNMAKNMQVIAKAKVPIVKFEDAETGYAFDVSFDVANGPEAAENVRALMDSLPPMRPLVMVLKVFLQQRELNEVYSGGLGSYALLVMVAAFLQLHPSRAPAASGYGYKGKRGAAEEIEGSLGVLLVDFLRLYGRALNNQEVGVSCRRGGSYFSKRQKGFFQPDRPFLYAVEDPNDPSNDLGRNSYNISRVRMAFDWAYCQLVAPAEPGVSLLQRIIRLDPVLFERSPPPYDDASPPPAAGGKKKRKDKDRRRSQEAGGSPPQQQQQGGESGDGKRQKKKKRRHRERSLSDGDEQEEGEAGAAPNGGGGGRWELDESGEDSEDERRHKKRHKHHKHHKHSHHHSRHGKHGGSGGAGEAAQQRRRQSAPGGGGGGQHLYFFD